MSEHPQRIVGNAAICNTIVDGQNQYFCRRSKGHDGDHSPLMDEEAFDAALQPASSPERGAGGTELCPRCGFAHPAPDVDAAILKGAASVVPTGGAPLDCRSETGETVALADAAIIILRLLSRRDLSIGPVRAALSDLRSDREVSNILWPPDEASVNAH